MVSGEEIGFTDGICGPQRFNLADECGDFVLRRADGAWAYQLAVVADDAAMGVTEVVRGNDLLLSAAQQIRGSAAFSASTLRHTPVSPRLQRRGAAASSATPGRAWRSCGGVSPPPRP